VSEVRVEGLSGGLVSRDATSQMAVVEFVYIVHRPSVVTERVTRLSQSCRPTCSAGRPGWLVGWLVDQPTKIWLVGWLVGWLVNRSCFPNPVMQ